MRLQSLLLAFAPVFLYTMLSTLLIGCKTEEVADVEKNIVRPVKFHHVESMSTRFRVTYPAVIEAEQSVNLAFTQGGLVTQLNVIDGQDVKKGQLIAQLDDRDKENNYLSNKAQFENANAEFERAKTLIARNLISRSDYERLRSSRAMAKAELRKAQKAVSDTRLKAPFTGQIAQVLVKNYQNVDAQEPIVTLQSQGDVLARVNVPSDVFVLSPQIVPERAVIELDVVDSQELPATFKEAKTTADPTTQVYELHFSFTPPEHLLVLPGMTGRVTFTLFYKGDRFAESVTVPASAISTLGDELFVWKIDPQTKMVSKQVITINANRITDNVVVMTGLKQGDIIAGAGASYLHEGMQVRAWQP